MDYHLIADKTLDIYIECGIHTFPINCFSILEHYGFRVYTYAQIQARNQRLYEMCHKYSQDAFQFQNIICYNQKMSSNRIRFSLMHELGHHFLGHKHSSLDTEEEANYFASHVLAPRIAVWQSRCKTADDIHDQFGLSYAASNRVLSDIQRWKHHTLYESEYKLRDHLYPPTIITLGKNDMYIIQYLKDMYRYGIPIAEYWQPVSDHPGPAIELNMLANKQGLS